MVLRESAAETSAGFVHTNILSGGTKLNATRYGVKEDPQNQSMEMHSFMQWLNPKVSLLHSLWLVAKLTIRRILSEEQVVIATSRPQKHLIRYHGTTQNAKVKEWK